jgi:hypothetical protein
MDAPRQSEKAKWFVEGGGKTISPFSTYVGGNLQNLVTSL